MCEWFDLMGCKKKITQMGLGLLSALVFVLVFPTTALAQAPEGATINDVMNLALKLETPDGSVYVKVFGQKDGPVRVPLKGRDIEALQIDVSVAEAKTLEVLIFSVADRGRLIQLVGDYELALPANAFYLEDLPETMPGGARKVELYELDRFGLEGWTIELSTLPTRGAKG